MRNIVLRFDMRSAPDCPQTPAERYCAAVEMAQWADQNTVDVVGLSEHHDTTDGFLSAPLQLAGMMVARTQRIRISVSALLVALHDPLRLAEDIALLDITSSGRFSATCGLGYRESEYACFDVDWAKRGAIFDEKLNTAYKDAMAKGLWKDKYAATNRAEYWAEAVQSFFDDNRLPDHDHNHVNTRKELSQYDPALANLVKEVFGDHKWRYKKPALRKKAQTKHLAGYEDKNAPQFKWPPELVEWYKNYEAEKRKQRE